MENKLAVTGVGIFVFMLLFCFVGPQIYHTNQLTVDFAHEELPPSAPRTCWAPTRTGSTCSAG